MSHYNWTRGVVTTGGTGDIVLGAVNGYPTFNQVIGVGPYFPYSILNADLTPRETGIGRMLDANTMRRETVYETFIAGALDNSLPAPTNVPVGAIVNTPATWQSLDADFAIDLIDGNRGGHQKIKQLDFAQNHLDVSGRNVTFYPAGRVLDLGDVSGTVDLDMTWPIITMNCTGNVTFTISNPPPAGFAADTRLEITRTTSSGAQVTFPGNVVFQSVIPPALADLQTTVVSFSTTDGGTSYIGFANAVVIQTTASGLATTWNPSDKASAIVLTDQNKTASIATAGVFAAVRAFGGKESGKHMFVLRCDQSVAATATSNSPYTAIGVTTADLNLGLLVGSTNTSYSVYFKPRSTAFQIGTYNNSVLTTAVPGLSFPVIGEIWRVLVNLDENKIWFAKNSTVIGGGDPEQGLGQTYNLQPNAIFFPAITLAIVNAGNPGIWALLNEVEDPYASLWPSFHNWTA